jgi:AcrR family transcriptional regulator
MTYPSVRQLIDAGTEFDAEHERVLNAALEAFLDFGIRRTSMGEIARRAALSPATLYRRFSGKDDIVSAVGRREIRRLIDATDARVDPGADAEEQVVALLVAFLHGVRGNRLLQRLLATEPEVVLPLLTVQAGPVLALGRAYLAEFLRRLPGAHGLSSHQVEPVSEMLARLALSIGLTPETCLPIDDDDALRQFARLLLGGVMGGWAKAG